MSSIEKENPSNNVSLKTDLNTTPTLTVTFSDDSKSTNQPLQDERRSNQPLSENSHVENESEPHAQNVASSRSKERSEDDYIPFGLLGAGKISLNDVILLSNISASSINIQKIVVNPPEGNAFEIRPTFHLTLSSPPHNYKTTIMKNLVKFYGGKIYDNITSPALRGTIDTKTREVVNSIAWESSGQLLVIDEFKPDRHGDIYSPVLKLMEDEEYRFALGHKSQSTRPKHKTTRGFQSEYQVKNNSINIKARSVYIFGTMHSLSFFKKTIQGKALADRNGVFIEYEIHDSLRHAINRGEIQPFRYIDYGVRAKVIISREDYEIIDNYAFEHSEKYNSRLLMNLLRMFAVIGKHDFHLYDLVIDSNDRVNKITLVEKTLGQIENKRN